LARHNWLMNRTVSPRHPATLEPTAVALVGLLEGALGPLTAMATGASTRPRSARWSTLELSAVAILLCAMVPGSCRIARQIAPASCNHQNPGTTLPSGLPFEMEDRSAERVTASVCLDVEGPDDIAPFLGFVGDELAELGGREREWRVTEIS
jgi:hypothetical protein